MNTESMSSANVHLRTNVPAGIPEQAVLMMCAACDLAGGPFPPAEAAYLQAIHNRVHHGYSTAA